MPTPIIALLDDEPDRIEEMRRLLALQFGDFQVATFANAPDIIAWLERNIESVRLISLDHDLGPNQVRDGEPFDPGIGRDVADYLATRKPQCHVILHTTNRTAIPGMRDVLENRGWTVSNVVPYDDLAWVRERWIELVQTALT